jgi:hypothetical protein
LLYGCGRSTDPELHDEAAAAWRVVNPPN